MRKKSRSSGVSVHDFIIFCKSQDACDEGLERIREFVGGHDPKALDARDLIMSVALDPIEYRRGWLEWVFSNLSEQLVTLRDDGRAHIKKGHILRYFRNEWEARKALRHEMKNSANWDDEVYPYVGSRFGSAMCDNIIPLMRYFMALMRSEEG